MSESRSGRETPDQAPPFHLAFFIEDLERARAFYGELLGCEEGRSAPEWIDFNFYGHQLSLHVRPNAKTEAAPPIEGTNPVDGEQVPLPHFGVVLSLPDWQSLADRLIAAGTSFVIPPTTRFEGDAGEQRTMFFTDPFGNALEVKGFADRSSLFES